jgi:hypothetical protein
MTITWSAPTTISGKIEYPNLYDAPAIGVWIQGAALPVWRRVGYLRIEVFMDGDFFNHQIKAIDFGKSIIQIPYRNYRLSFEPLESLIALYPNLSIQITPIGTNLMSISYPNTARETGDPVDTLFTPLITSAQALAPDPNRHDGTVYNRTNRTIYVRWGTTAATLTNLPVTAGANVKIPLDYTGAIQIIRATGNLTGEVLIQVISYLTLPRL